MYIILNWKYEKSFYFDFIHVYSYMLPYMSEIYEIYMIINYCFDLHTLQQISKNSLSHFVQKRKQLKTLGHF